MIRFTSRTLTLSALALAVVTANASAARGGITPQNDLCTDAIPVALPSSTAGSTDDATLDGVASCGTANTAPGVWYSVTGTGNTLNASTCGTANYDTKISVFCGDCSDSVGDLVCVAGNDDGTGCPGFTSEIAWCSQPGVEYLILVHGFGAAVGDFTLTLSDDGVPCVGAVACPLPPAPISAFCFGTAPAPCNCGNHGAPGNGCANGVYPAGANLAAQVPDPTFGPMPSVTLLASGMTPLSLSFLLQGSQQAGGGTGVPFGDGLLCVGGSVMPLAVRPTFLGSTRFTVMPGADLAFIPGSAHYQVVYITPGTFDICGPQGRNLNATNGLTIDWFL